ncbi:GntP family permease, partial [Clostridium estertheticum]|nr:GntP family permease [Clostridium estertheticum]
MAVISWSGAIFGLIVAIVLIFRKVSPVYALFGGAIIGGLVGG